MRTAIRYGASAVLAASVPLLSLVGCGGEHLTVTKAADAIPVLLSVWGSGSKDVWAVGASYNYHWDGNAWAATVVRSRFGSGPFDIGISLKAIWGSGPNDVWEVGEALGLEFKHWDGAQWTNFPPNEVIHVNALWGSGSTDIWAVGSQVTSIAYHWDGISWGTLRGIDPSDTAPTHGMNAIWGSRSNDGWAVGSGDDFVAAGILHWDGSTWSPVSNGLAAPLFGIWGSGSADIWVVGLGGLIAHWNGSAWTPFASGSSENLFGVWGSGPEDVWAVGSAGTVLHWNGQAWSRVPSPSSNDLRAVWGSSAADVWGVGDRVILHLSSD